MFGAAHDAYLYAIYIFCNRKRNGVRSRKRPETFFCVCALASKWHPNPTHGEIAIVCTMPHHKFHEQKNMDSIINHQSEIATVMAAVAPKKLSYLEGLSKVWWTHRKQFVNYFIWRVFSFPWLAAAECQQKMLLHTADWLRWTCKQCAEFFWYSEHFSIAEWSLLSAHTILRCSLYAVHVHLAHRENTAKRFTFMKN